MESQVNGLSVCYGQADLLEGRTRWDDGGWGWRIKIINQQAVLPVKFLRKKDALMAMHAIANVIDWTMDERAMVKVLRPMSNRVLRLMTEALQW